MTKKDEERISLTKAELDAIRDKAAREGSMDDDEKRLRSIIADVVGEVLGSMFQIVGDDDDDDDDGEKRRQRPGGEGLIDRLLRPA